MAHQRYKAGNYKQALESSLGVYERSPRRTDNLMLLGAIYYQVGLLELNVNFCWPLSVMNMMVFSFSCMILTPASQRMKKLSELIETLLNVTAIWQMLGRYIIYNIFFQCLETIIER